MIKIFNRAKIVNLRPTVNSKINNVNEFLENCISKISKRAEYEISDSHYYQNIDEVFNFNNPDYKKIIFNISQDDNNFSGHMLEITIQHPYMQLEATRPLAYGSKKDILEFLNDKKSLDTIKNDIEQMIKDLKNI